MIAGFALAAVLFVGFAVWFAAPQMFGATDYLGRPSTGADKSTPATTVGTGNPTQREAISKVAKEDPAGNEDPNSKHTHNNKQNNEPKNHREQQHQQLRSI